MKSFIGKWKAILLAPVVPVVWATLSLLGVFAGPFGTQDAFSLGLRAVFWPVLVAVAIVLAVGARAAVEDVFGLRRFRSQAPVLAALLTLFLTPPLFVVTRGLLGESDGKLARLGEIAVFVFAISIGISAIRHALAARPVPPAAATPAGKTQPRLLARLPKALRGPLRRLSVRDHYVDVTTAAGSTSVLMRLADAIAETDGVDGMQIHRSHWVAVAAVRGAKISEGKPVLVMEDGAELPVSGSFRAQAVARGLLPNAAGSTRPRMTGADVGATPAPGE